MENINSHLIQQIDRLSTLCFVLTFFLWLMPIFLFSETLRYDFPPLELRHIAAFTGLVLLDVIFFIWMKLSILKLKKRLESDL